MQIDFDAGYVAERNNRDNSVTTEIYKQSWLHGGFVVIKNAQQEKLSPRKLLVAKTEQALFWLKFQRRELGVSPKTGSRYEKMSRMQNRKRPVRARVSTRMASLFFASCIFCGLSESARSHPDMEILIARITAQLTNHPSPAGLYLKRAELHRQHADWTNAAMDYATALRLNPQLVEVYLGRGRLLYEMDRASEGLVELDRFVRHCPTDARGYSARARAFRALGRHAEAATDFDRAIEASTVPSIADYLDRGHVLAACGTNRLGEALRGLDEALKRHRGSSLLQDLAVDLELKRGDFTNALRRLDQAFSNSARKEWWRTRRGEILEASGQPHEALTEYREALGNLAVLNPYARGTRTTSQLEARIQAAIARLTGVSSSP